MQFGFGTTELVNVQELPVDSIQRISIHYISEAITVYEADGENLILKEYMNRSNPSLLARISIDEEGSLVIRHGERPILMPNLRGYVEVYLPRQYFGALSLRNVSGKVDAPLRLVLSELAVHSTSGRITLEEAMAGTAVLSTVSGAINVARLRAEADVHSTSGAIRIGEAEGEGEFKTVSSAIDISYRSVTGDIVAGSTSGRIRLSLPSMLSFSLDANSISGSIHVPIAGALTGGKHSLSGTIGDKPQMTVRASTISSRIEVVHSG